MINVYFFSFLHIYSLCSPTYVSDIHFTSGTVHDADIKPVFKLFGNFVEVCEQALKTCIFFFNSCFLSSNI